MYETPRSRSRIGSPELRDDIAARAENRPGVYRFLGPRGEILYIGKSIRVRSRLLSYFRTGGSAKQTELMRVARSAEWEYLPNEFEALFREFRSIRAFRPRFNRRHRLERKFAWIRLTRGIAPRLVATRSPKADGSRYFGPFPAPGRLPEILRELSVSVGLRDCRPGLPMRFSDQIDLFDRPLTPGCPRAELDTCPAPCAGGCSRSEYAENVRSAIDFLSGRSDGPLDRLAERVSRASERRDFEFAKRLLERAERIGRVRDDVVSFGAELDSLTFVYLVPDAAGDSHRGYALSRGRILASFQVSSAEGIEARVARDLEHSLEGSVAAPHSLTEDEREEILLVTRWFRWKPEERERALTYSAFLAGCRLPGTRSGTGPAGKEIPSPRRVSVCDVTGRSRTAVREPRRT